VTMTMIKVKAFKVRGKVIETSPTTPGLWFLACDENDFTFEPTAVYEVKGHLMVEDLNLGRTDLQAFHDGLINPRWLRQQ